MICLFHNSYFHTGGFCNFKFDFKKLISCLDFCWKHMHRKTIQIERQQNIILIIFIISWFLHRFHIASKYADKNYVACWYGNPWQHQKKQWMKELLQQTVVNEELIHCQKLLGKTKHIKKKRPGPILEILGSVWY